MLKKRIASLAGEAGGGLRLGEVIVGLGYTMACLAGGACGLAYTLREELERGCDAYEEAGRLSGRELEEVFAWLGAGNIIASSIALAAANAVLLPPADCHATDLWGSLRLQPGESLATAGRFIPMEPLFEEAGVELAVIEQGNDPAPLRTCDVALITGTSIINDTIEGLLATVERAREVVVLGPSTPYAPAAFSGTPVTLLAGSTIADMDRVRAIVREGGGTQTMGKNLGRWVARIR
jgi:uncharacterized protein